MQSARMQALRPETSCFAAHRELWQRPHVSTVCSLHQHAWTPRLRSTFHQRTLQRARTSRVARHGSCGLKVQAGWGDWFKKGDNTSVTRKEYQPQVSGALQIRLVPAQHASSQQCTAFAAKVHHCMVQGAKTLARHAGACQPSMQVALHSKLP